MKNRNTLLKIADTCIYFERDKSLYLLHYNKIVLFTFINKKVPISWNILFYLAEEEGFEPSHTVTCLRAFQARPFSLLGIPPC